MSRRDWVLIASALLAVPLVFALGAIADASFELGVLHSTWRSGVAIFGFVLVGLYLLWSVKLSAGWKSVGLMVVYAPVMFVVITWLAVAIQFEFDDCMAQQSLARDVRNASA